MSKKKKHKTKHINIEETGITGTGTGTGTATAIHWQKLSDEEAEALIPQNITDPATRRIVRMSIQAKGGPLKFSKRHYDDDIESK